MFSKLDVSIPVPNLDVNILFTHANFGTSQFVLSLQSLLQKLLGSADILILFFVNCKLLIFFVKCKLFLQCNQCFDRKKTLLGSKH